MVAGVSYLDFEEPLLLVVVLSDGRDVFNSCEYTTSGVVGRVRPSFFCCGDFKYGTNFTKQEVDDVKKKAEQTTRNACERRSL